MASSERFQRLTLQHVCGKTKGFQQFPALKNKISPKSTFKCKSPAALHTQKQQQSHKHPLKPCRKSSANHRCVYVYVYVYVHTHIYILYSSYFLESTEERGKKFPGFEKWVSKSCVQTIRAGKAARYLQHMELTWNWLWSQLSLTRVTERGFV